jgi:molybdopterin/thiamine biosynthesis adenylyltransferase/rhodanese-related sulfurtransferase
MAGDRELVLEVDAERARELLGSDDPPALVDIREEYELQSGTIAGSEHIPMGEVGARLDPERDRRIVLYCAHGNRSLRLAKAMHEHGFEDVVSLAGGIVAWAEAGFPVEAPGGLDEAQRVRYSRHVLIPEIGVAGQQRLLAANVLVVGAGGLGSPAALYLAAAGIGRLGIVDDDAVDESNLQRQVLHSTAALGEPKVESAERRVRELNPDVEVVAYQERLGADNVDRILDEGWEVIVDGADNFPTRYLLNDASVWHGIPVVHGSIFRFEGQATVFAPGKGAARGARLQDARALPGRPSEMTGRSDHGHTQPQQGPCYRCLFPQPPPPELAPSCAEGGVLGVLPGVIGSIQGAEALKLVLGIGKPLVGRLLLYDALAGSFDEVSVRRDPGCPVCGDSPTITEYVDYVEFCAGTH